MSRQAGPETEVTVADALPEFADVFPFERFNRVQSATLPALCETDDNVVVGAPTASGKTAVAEVAICEALRDGGTALYVAPLRALTNEREREWQRFEEMGYSVAVVTGERDLDPRRARRADVLVMTPEKVDSATRKHDSDRYGFVADVDCVVVDEVHLLDAERRGSTLEVVVARLRRLCDPRIVALSATMRNVGEVAAWLDAPESATFDFGRADRPVPLEAGVTTYSHGENAFADKYRRLYRALDAAEPHVRDGAGALTFVASRGDAVQAAETAVDELAERGIDLETRGDYDHHRSASDLDDDRLRETVLDGVAFHHAGLSAADKERVEAWFREGAVRLLFSTSTLAWGVNLPARCVVIRDTTYHDPLEGDVDMSAIDLLQMLGRAGRPGYDDRGYAYVVADRDRADRYRDLLREGKSIESRLAADLPVHLNAEIALGAIASVEDAVAWLDDTFYAVRARRAGASAGGEGTDDDPPGVPTGHSVRERLDGAIDGLIERGFVERAEAGTLEATSLGRLTSRYYLRLETARAFADLAERPDSDPAAILRTVARAAEFDSVSARSGEADAVEGVLDEAAPGLDPGTRKVLAILRSGMAGTTPSALAGDAWVIRQNAGRLLAALRTTCDRFDAPAAANAVSRVAARLETGVDGDAVGLTAIDGVGAARADTLASAGLDSPAAVCGDGPSRLVAAGIGESVAERLVENAADLPAVAVDWGDLPATIPRGESRMHEVTVRSTAGGARAALALSVNGVEMTATTTYLGEATLPVGVFGADEDRLAFVLAVVFPDLPLAPVERATTVSIDER